MILNRLGFIDLGKGRNGEAARIARIASHRAVSSPKTLLLPLAQADHPPKYEFYHGFPLQGVTLRQVGYCHSLR